MHYISLKNEAYYPHQKTIPKTITFNYTLTDTNNRKFLGLPLNNAKHCALAQLFVRLILFHLT